MNRVLARLDVGRLLLAILIALALYSAVRAEQNPPETGTFDVPVDVVNVPSGLVLVSGQSSTAQLRVSAPREEWVSLRPSSFRAYVQLSRGTTAIDEYPVTVDVPNPRVRVVEVIPPRLPLRLDEIVERSVPVRLTSVGNVPFGYEAADAELDPATVKVSGPSALVRRVEAAALEVRLDAATVDVDGRYTLTPVDGQAQPMVTETRALRMTPGEVHIRIPITQQLSYKTVGVQPDFGGTPQSGFVIGGITAEPATVTIVGAPRALASINFAGTERIDVTNAASTISRQVDVVVPEGLSVLQQDTVHVSVQILPLILSQSFVTVPLPDNLAPNLQITSTLPSVQVVLQGPTNTLQGLRPSDLRTSLNLAGLGSGSQQATVEVSAPAGVTIESVSPRIIAVTLTSTSTPTPVAVATSAPAQESAVFASPDDEEGE